MTQRQLTIAVTAVADSMLLKGVMLSFKGCPGAGCG